MLERKGGFTFVASCDDCGEMNDTGEEEFHDALDAIKRRGWKVYVDGGWCHQCLSCQQEEIEDELDF